jgi:hypothetical protein
MPKLEPAVMTMEFTLPVSTAARYIDISAAASVLNRKFFRQGLEWVIGGATIIASPLSAGTITMSHLQTNWVTANSWVKGMKSWSRQQNEALAEGDKQSIKGKFNDFKIFADIQHSQTAAPHFLLPRDIDGTEYDAPEEWLHSQFVVPNDTGVVGSTVEYTMHMHGADTATSRGSIVAYRDSRSMPQSPDPATPTTASIGLYTDMFNVGMDDSEIVANAEFRNNELPYDQDEYPGGGTNGPTLQLMNRIFLNPASTMPGKYNLRGAKVPCGLIKIDAATVTQEFTLILHMVPGEHRGYMARPMQEMN